MIAYFAAMPTLFFTAIAHKMGMKYEEEAVLFIDKGLFVSRGLGYIAEELEKEKLFAHVAACGLLCSKNFPVDATDDLKEKKVLEYYDNLFEQNGYRAERFNEIYVLNDDWGGDINIYLCLRKIHYTWLEAGKNHLNPNISAMTKSLASLYKKYRALTPFADYADACILSSSDDSKKKLEKKGYSVWNRDECFDNISLEDLKKLFRCFHLDTFGFDKENRQDSVLVIKNSSELLRWKLLEGNRNTGSVNLAAGLDAYSKAEVFSVMDKVAVDFYAPEAESMDLKCHIHDYFDSVTAKRIYGTDIRVLPNVPFEIMGKYFLEKNIKYNTIIGTMSTSLDAIGDKNCNNLFCLGINYAKTWWFYISIYTILLFAKQQEYKRIYCSDMLKSQIEFLAVTMQYQVELIELKVSDIGKIRNSLLLIDWCRFPGKLLINGLHDSNTLAVLNMELCEGFFEEDPDFFVPLCIKKAKLRELECDILLRDETVWIYAKDIQVRRAARNFAYERDFFHLGLKASVEKIALHQAVRLFEQRQMAEESWKWKEKTRQLARQVANFVEFTALDVTDSLSMAACAKKITDIYKYFDFLRIIRWRYMIIFSVRDTPGNCLPDDILQQIHELGFTKFSKELWQMYIGVSNKADILCDNSGENREAAVLYKCENPLVEIDIEVVSMAWRKGDKAEIKINGVDYSVNLRGINIVVYDAEKRILIDSIGFDAHIPQWRFVRK